MLRTMLKSKIHRATVTGADLDYVGSLSLDAGLMAAANLLAGEQVQVVNVTNGARLVTYAIPAPEGSGTVQLNGAAARLAQPGDVVIILAYALVTEAEASTHTPAVVFVDGRNRPVPPEVAERMVREGRWVGPAQEAPAAPGGR